MKLSQRRAAGGIALATPLLLGYLAFYVALFVMASILAGYGFEKSKFRFMKKMIAMHIFIF